jgi:two-component system response regulator RegA
MSTYAAADPDQLIADSPTYLITNMNTTADTSEKTTYTAATLGYDSILIVDDTIILRDRLAMAFRQRGFRVETASNYDEGLTTFSTNPTELAVLDLRMPGRSGLELLQRIKDKSPDCQVVMLSGFGSIAAGIDAIRAGAVNFLSKPADADEILAAFARGDQATVAEAKGEDFPAPSLARAEWEHIHRVLSDCGGNISEAARRLGIHRRSLQRKLRKRAPGDPSLPGI